MDAFASTFGPSRGTPAAPPLTDDPATRPAFDGWLARVASGDVDSAASALSNLAERDWTPRARELEEALVIKLTESVRASIEACAAVDLLFGALPHPASAYERTLDPRSVVQSVRGQLARALADGDKLDVSAWADEHLTQALAGLATPDTLAELLFGGDTVAAIADDSGKSPDELAELLSAPVWAWLVRNARAEVANAEAEGVPPDITPNGIADLLSDALFELVDGTAPEDL